MKYTDILGKDFKTKKDAWKYFKSQLYSIEQPVGDNYVIFTEETPIKHSQMQYLFNNYLTEDKKILNEVFRGDTPYNWGCKFLRNGVINLTFELGARNQDRIPIKPARIFTCFGAATTNYTLNEKKTARKLIRYQRNDYLKKFIGKDELIWNSIFECDKCECKVTYEELEVHHYWPSFNGIYNEWRDNVWKEDLFPDSACSYFNADADESWCDFHFNLSHYQKLCKPCHAKETYA